MTSDKMDLPYVWIVFQSTTANMIIIISLCMVAVLYAGLFLLVRYWDALDQRRLSMVPLCGKDSLHKYEITVVTGQRPGAGTYALGDPQIQGNSEDVNGCHKQALDIVLSVEN